MFALYALQEKAAEDCDLNSLRTAFRKARIRLVRVIRYDFSASHSHCWTILHLSLSNEVLIVEALSSSEVYVFERSVDFPFYMHLYM